MYPKYVFGELKSLFRIHPQHGGKVLALRSTIEILEMFQNDLKVHKTR